MALLTDAEIKHAIGDGEIGIEPFEEACLQPASYDVRVGSRAIITKSLTLGELEELKKRVEKEVVKELLVEREGSISIPPSGFALVTTEEYIKLSNQYAGHIGMRSYYTRKGLLLLSGLQIDPGFEGVLVLGICNLSPRTLIIEYKDPICTIEFHRLNFPVDEPYSGRYMAEQREGRIPAGDKDYLRTIETMSISDLTQALLTLSRNVNAMATQLKLFWIPLILVLIAAIISFFT